MNLRDLQYLSEARVNTPYTQQFSAPSLSDLALVAGGSTMGIATPRQQREAQTIKRGFQNKVVTPIVNAVVDPFYAMTPGVDQRRQDARRRILEKVATAVTDPMMGTFAGVGAKMADMVALARSLEMKAAGVADDVIWKETGWTHGFPDGRPRFEIDDSAAHISAGTLDDMKGWGNMPNSPADEFINHPELFDNYPQTRNINVQQTVGDSGSYSPQGQYDPMTGRSRFDDGTIHVGIEKDPRGIALHELQHAVQQNEGFAKGGNLESAPVLDMDAISAIRTEKNQLGIDPYAIMNKKAGGYQLQQYEVDRFKKWEELTAKEDELLANRLQPYEAYRRLAGEVEARLTQRRMDLNAKQRRAQYPISQMDVKPQDQIVRFGTGKAQSIEQREPFVIARNPTKAEAQSILDKARYKDVRGIKDPHSGDVFIADANWTTHKDLAEQTGVDWYDLIGADARNRFITKDPLDPRMYRTRD